MRIFLPFLLFLSAFASSPSQMAQHFANQHKTRLPLRTMPNLILTDILAVGEVLLYRYSVNDTKALAVLNLKKDELAEYKNSLAKIAKKMACEDKNALVLLKNGIKIEHLFYSQNSRLLFEIWTHSDSCL